MQISTGTTTLSLDGPPLRILAPGPVAEGETGTRLSMQYQPDSDDGDALATLRALLAGAAAAPRTAPTWLHSMAADGTAVRRALWGGKLAGGPRPTQFALMLEHAPLAHAISAVSLHDDGAVASAHGLAIDIAGSAVGGQQPGPVVLGLRWSAGMVSRVWAAVLAGPQSGAFAHHYPAPVSSPYTWTIGGAQQQAANGEALLALARFDPAPGSDLSQAQLSVSVAGETAWQGPVQLLMAGETLQTLAPVYLPPWPVADGDAPDVELALSIYTPEGSPAPDLSDLYLLPVAACRALSGSLSATTTLTLDETRGTAMAEGVPWALHGGPLMLRPGVAQRVVVLWDGDAASYDGGTAVSVTVNHHAGY